MMSQSDDCTQNFDPQKLVHDGTSRQQRAAKALEPGFISVDERTTAELMVFAQNYSAYLNYFNTANMKQGNWQTFFNSDISILLAVAATSDVESYRNQTKEYLEYIRNRDNKENEENLRDNLERLFSCCASLALQINYLEQKLPAEIAFKQKLQNLVKQRLAPALQKLISWFKGGLEISPAAQRPLNPPSGEKAATFISNGKEFPVVLLGANAVKFSNLKTEGLGKIWTGGREWTVYYDSISKDKTIYEGGGANVFKRIHHIATHYHFTSALEQFLKEYAYVRKEAQAALEEVMENWDQHQPHYALFLAFLRLLETARQEVNMLTRRHLDFYYKKILQLKEKAPLPGKAHILVELAKQVDNHYLKSGDLFKAGKDNAGKNVFFTADYEFVANRAQVAGLKTVYLHGNKSPASQPGNHEDRVYASAVANSSDGLGADITTTDLSWSPFCNKSYKDGKLDKINMPYAEIGFALFSHHLFLAGGTRKIILNFTVSGDTSKFTSDYKDDIECFLTAEKEWHAANIMQFFYNTEKNKLQIIIDLNGAAPPIVSWSEEVHGYSFATSLPVLLVKIKQKDSRKYLYTFFREVLIEHVDLEVNVIGLKTLAVSNDFGPVDASKPFQPWGAKPAANNSLIIGSREAFQKTLTHLSVSVTWHTESPPYENKSVSVVKHYLQNGTWQPDGNLQSDPIFSTSFDFNDMVTASNPPVFVDAPDNTPQENYSNTSRHGYLGLKLSTDFGQDDYEKGLITYIDKVVKNTLSPGEAKPTPPTGPFIGEISLTYTSKQSANLTDSELSVYNERKLYFCHITPFGHAEQHPWLKNISENNTVAPDQSIFLLPPMKHKKRDNNELSKNSPVLHEAEFYIGIMDLKPPQNLSLLFQVADGTADPKSNKPHIYWSYLRNNEWLPFAYHGVQDKTNGFLQSGIVAFAMPGDASNANTLLPSGMHWIRAAVPYNESESVCDLLQVSAQAMEVIFQDHHNDTGFGEKVLEAGTINKLNAPSSHVKKILQPFESFGGRGQESPEEFQTRISERLRHKDRAIALWDYERLVLEAFPGIYKVKCLNHTEYEEKQNDSGYIYRERAAGHVTLITISVQYTLNRRDPLRPYTSLGLLTNITDFLQKKLSCFVTLHVKNPEFEEVKVKCKVRFKPGVDETFYLETLEKEIQKYLSPWAFSNEDYPRFDNQFQKSAIIDFIEELSYIDYITDFVLQHTWQKTDGTEVTVEKDRVEGSKAISVLVSARKHTIDPINTADISGQGEACLC